MKRFILAAACGLFLASPAFSQNVPCGPSGEMLKKVTEEFGEQIRFRGIMQNGNVIQIYVHPQTGHFSVFIVSADGLTCVPVWGTEAGFFPGGVDG